MNKRGKVFVLSALITALLYLFAIPFALASPISGAYGTCQWTIEGGVLTVKTGQMPDYSSVNKPGWLAYASQITSVVVESGAKTGKIASYLFSGLNQATDMDMRGLDTSKASDISFMFFGCRKLQTIDVSGFNTKNVNTIRGIFQNCGTSAAPMKIIGLGTWDASGFTSVHDAFRTSYLDNLRDIEAWQTASLKNMDSFLYRASIAAQELLDLSSWNVSQVVDLNYAFNGIDVFDYSIAGWNPVAPPRIPYAFGGNMSRLDLSNWNNLYIPDPANPTWNFENVFLVKPKVIILNPNFKFYDIDGFSFNPPNDDVYTGLWQAVGSGTEADPKGATYTTAQLRALYPGTAPNGPKETYVWQNRVPPPTVYEAIKVPLTVTKVLKNGSLKAGEFAFQLKDAKGKVLAEVRNKADGSVVFPDRTFSNVVSNYIFTIRELPGKDTKITYDKTVYTVKITTKDVGGKLVATVNLEKDGVSYAGSIIFTNLREAPKTGDSTERILILLLFASAMLGIGANAVNRGRRDKR